MKPLQKLLWRFVIIYMGREFLLHITTIKNDFYNNRLKHTANQKIIPGGKNDVQESKGNQ